MNGGNGHGLFERSSRSIRVLHVDDDPEFAAVTASVLEREDDRIEVLTEPSAGDGLARLEVESVDCIVSDYRMPSIDGLEFLDAVRENYPDLPFILFTGDGSEAVASEAITAGATDYLRKGNDTDQYIVLFNKIHKAVEQTRARTQRRHLSRALETARDGISLLDEDGQFLSVTEGYAELYGYEPAELVGEHRRQLSPGERAEIAGEEILQTVDREGYWHGHTTGLRADGSTFPEDHVVVEANSGRLISTVRSVAVRDARGQKFKRLHAATRELITADTPREIAAIASEAADDILDFPMNGIHLYDADANGLVPIAVSESSQNLLGDPPVLGEDSIAWDVYQRGEPQIHDNVSEADEAYNPDTQIQNEMHFPLDDHGVFILSSTAAEAFDDTDVTLAKILAANVTSALNRTAQAQKLEQLQRRTRTLMNTSTVEATVEDAVNAACEILDAELSGFHRVTDDQRLELLAMTDTVSRAFDSLPEYDRDVPAGTVASFLWKAFDSGEPTYINDTANHEELAGQTPAGSGIIYPIDDYGMFIVSWMEPEAFSETDAKLVEILASTLTSALQRVERESLLRERTEALEHQNDRLEQFADIVSHDLRNPLSVANGYLELEQKSGDSEYLSEIEDALNRMDLIIENTLILAREGRTVGDMVEFGLGPLATSCWEQVPTAEATLETADDVTVRGDPTRVRHVFENLFRNAVEHGGNDVSVRVGTVCEGGFYVEDDGPGLPENERERVFEQGFSTAEENTGFGLSITEEIVDAHGWEIRVTESDSGGARFEITGVECIGE